MVIVEVQSVPSTRLVTAMPIVTVVLIVIVWLVPNCVQVVPFVE